MSDGDGADLGTTSVTQAILSRRSVRDSLAPTPIPVETIREIVLCGLSAPASKSAHPWRFHIVSDRPLLTEIADLASRAPNAAAWVPFDPRTGRPHEEWISTVAESANVLRNAAVGIFVENKAPFTGGRRALLEADRSSLSSALFGYMLEAAGIGAAIQNMLLAAGALGVRGTFMGDLVVVEPEIQARLHTSGDLVGVLALGSSSERITPHDHRLLLDDDSSVVWCTGDRDT